MYELKIFHMTCVVVSFSGFFLRGLALFTRPELLQPRWIRIVPHIIDSLLFFSGIGLVVGMHYLPWQHPWLVVKLVSLLVYIALGHVVLGRRREFSTAVRFICWLLALTVISYMVYVARTRQVIFW